MEQPEAQPRPGDGIRGLRVVGAHGIRVSNADEYVECDGHGRCCSLVLDFPGSRKEIPCPYTAGMHGHSYSRALMETLFSGLSTLGLVQHPMDRLVLDLLRFALDFAINGHSCPSDGPRLVPVASISVANIFDMHLDEAEARSLQETTAWAKRATHESVEALPTFGAAELERDASCVICIEGFDHVATRMPCGHVFHIDCIVEWLQNSHLCPLCRFQMPAALVQIST